MSVNEGDSQGLVPLAPVSESQIDADDWKATSRFASTGIAIAILWPLLALATGFLTMFYTMRPNICGPVANLSDVDIATGMAAIGFFVAVALTVTHASSVKTSPIYLAIAMGATAIIFVVSGVVTGFLSMISVQSADVVNVPFIAPYLPALFALVVISLTGVLRPQLREIRHPVAVAVIAAAVLVAVASVALTLAARSGCV